MRKPCSKTNQIKPLQSSETSFAKRASFLWQDTIIWLAKMSLPDGRKSISVTMEDVPVAEIYHDGKRATFIISSAASVPNDAGACTTCKSSAPTATEKSMSGC
jgi:hypothetical protein